MDAKIYIDKYDAYSNDVANIFSLLQNNVTRSFRFYEDKWSGKRVTVQNYWGNLSTLMDNAKIDEFIKTSQV